MRQLIGMLRSLLSRRGKHRVDDVVHTRKEPVQRRHRAIHVDPDYPVTLGDVAASRLMELWHHNGDPLGLAADADFGGGTEARKARLVHVVRAALSGTLRIGPDHRRDPLNPITCRMLELCGIDPDGFAVISVFHPGEGLYIDGADGYTIAKSTHDWSGGEFNVTVRVRVPASDRSPRMTWWQGWDGGCTLAVDGLPHTIVNALPGRPLSAVLGDGFEGMTITSAETADTDRFVDATVLHLASTP